MKYTPKERLEVYQRAKKYIEDYIKHKGVYDFGLCLALSFDQLVQGGIVNKTYPDNLGQMKKLYPEVYEQAPDSIKQLSVSFGGFWWGWGFEANKIRLTALDKAIELVKTKIK
jgi:hypothetical protein